MNSSTKKIHQIQQIIARVHAMCGASAIEPNRQVLNITKILIKVHPLIHHHGID
jgi:hypothetical protein